MSNYQDYKNRLNKSKTTSIDYQVAKNHIDKNSHLYNGSELHSAGHTNEEAIKKVKEMRSNGVHASMAHISGPKTGPKSKHAILVPKTTGDSMNKSEPLQKDIVDFKKKKAEKEAKMTAEKRALYEGLKDKTNNRSTDQKIADALKAQGKYPGDYTKDRWSSHGSGIMDQPTEHEQKLADFKERHKKVIERQKNEEYAAAKDDPYKQMKMRYEDNPEILKYIEENESKPSKEPYYGNATFHGLGYYTPPSKAPRPYPHYNVTPNGVLGHEVSDFGHDPFMWMDTKYGATKKVLQEHKDKPLDIHTRSDLVGHDDYMEHLNPKKHKINMHILSGNYNLNRLLSPGTPSTKCVLTAAQKLHDAGHDVTVVHDSIPGLALRYPQNGLSSMEVARHVKENHPGLKFKVNEIPEGEKHTNFMNNIHKILGGNNDESE